MSNTPQTDNIARGNHVVPTEWAEQLERERNKARDELKEAWEEIASACDDWLNSIIQEPSLEFIKGVRDYAKGKLPTEN
jgi:hypothetical protein